jgi:hypothetical protein
MIIPRYAVITRTICGTNTNSLAKVWLIEETGEVFVDYEKFLNRYEIYWNDVKVSNYANV